MAISKGATLGFLLVAALAAPSVSRAAAASPDWRRVPFEDLTATLSSAGPNESLADAARERRDRLFRMIEFDPEEVLRLSLPAEDRDSLPPGLRDLVEERMELEGSLHVLVEDRREGAGRRLTLLETDSGERYALRFASGDPRLSTGARVHVRGVRVGLDIAVESGVTDVSPIPQAPPGAPVPPAPIGRRQ